MKKVLTISIFAIAALMMCSFVISEWSSGSFKSFKLADGLHAGIIDLNFLDDYDNLPIPNYITKDNTPANNPITDAGATLGRVLFYDKKLSKNNTVACASCHQQEFAFSDTARGSVGVAGVPPRHSMRLINIRFADEAAMFWDERAVNLEAQATQPIQDHLEMGFSNTLGDPDLDSLIRKLEATDYYPTLFEFVYGDAAITENRMQRALAQFVRSIQSFDAKYDVGRAQVANDGAPFPNFTNNENAGKALFLAPPQIDVATGNRIGGGLGCGGCHRAPEFDIDPNSQNNGVIRDIQNTLDVIVTRAPSLRDVVDANGNANGPMMHNGLFNTLAGVAGHYNQMPNHPNNTNLDPRLRTPGQNSVPINLQMTNQERNQLVAFMQTLTGSDVYTNPIWSNPFVNDELTVIPVVASHTSAVRDYQFRAYPNPISNYVQIECDCSIDAHISIYNVSGQLIMQHLQPISNTTIIATDDLNTGIYIMQISDTQGNIIGTQKLVKL